MSNIKKWMSGDNNVLCDVCGKKRKRSECTMAYGSGTIPVVMSCTDGCADTNHPLNYPPPIIFDGRPVEDARPEASNVYISNQTIGDVWESEGISWESAEITWDDSDSEGVFQHAGSATYYWGRFLSDPSTYWGHISNDSVFSTSVNHYWGNF